ncbi:hypothetical protein IU450_22955 [Nocardia abscessus]|nr:hypothetical protein [Nocardia abscessus]MBF6338732.1 hypothetical protein [Nocardia abscessus]
MTTPFEDPNESPLFVPPDADDPVEALAEAIILGDEHWIRMLGVEESTD